MPLRCPRRSDFSENFLDRLCIGFFVSLLLIYILALSGVVVHITVRSDRYLEKYPDQVHPDNYEESDDSGRDNSDHFDSIRQSVDSPNSSIEHGSEDKSEL